jgi:hypothetical protein
MNNGFIGFPGKINFSENDIKTFDSSGSYTILQGTKKLYIFAVGGGGGGGGGARQSGNAYGGGGGGGGVMILKEFYVSDLGGPGQTLFITIGAGGTSGAAATGDSSNGSNGGPGGATQINIAGKPGALLYCPGGNFGSGGTGASGAAGSGQSCFIESYSVTGGGGGASGGGITVAAIYSHGGAGGGFKITSGSNGGAITLQGTAVSGIMSSLQARANNVYNAGAADSSTKPFDSYQHILGIMSPGFGGPGGGGGTTATNAGGNGFRGSGGGGGGGSTNGIAASAGGTGGNGYVAILAIS